MKSNKRNIAGAITTLNPADFNAGGNDLACAQLLQGKVASLNITKNGDPNSQYAVILQSPSTCAVAMRRNCFLRDRQGAGRLHRSRCTGRYRKRGCIEDASSTAIYGARAATRIMIT